MRTGFNPFEEIELFDYFNECFNVQRLRDTMGSLLRYLATKAEDFKTYMDKDMLAWQDFLEQAYNAGNKEIYNEYKLHGTKPADDLHDIIGYIHKLLSWQVSLDWDIENVCTYLQKKDKHAEHILNGGKFDEDEAEEWRQQFWTDNSESFNNLAAKLSGILDYCNYYQDDNWEEDYTYINEMI